LKNIPDNKIVNINININSNNIEDNKKIKNEININSKNKINFLDTKPINFRADYKEKEEYKELLKLDDYSEEMADLYMYEEEKFKKEQPKDLIYKYDKEALQVEGMKILFTKLQEDPDNRNVMIRKTKSGKCYIYETEWVENELQKIITKICNKLCDCLYDKETSLNYFMRLVIGSQPRRCKELRTHIEKEIIYKKGLLQSK
jgi:hypothetical protein